MGFGGFGAREHGIRRFLESRSKKKGHAAEPKVGIFFWGHFVDSLAPTFFDFTFRLIFSKEK